MPVKDRKHKNISFVIYITEVLKQTNSNIRLSSDAKNFLQNLIIKCIDFFAIYSNAIMDHNRYKTLSSKDIQKVL